MKNKLEVKIHDEDGKIKIDLNTLFKGVAGVFNISFDKKEKKEPKNEQN